MKKIDDKEVYSLIKNNIEDRYILQEVWQAKDIIYDANIKHDFHLKTESTYNEVLRVGYKRDNMFMYLRLLFQMTRLRD